MKKLSDRVERKKEMGKLYEKYLTGVPGIELIPTDYADTAPWFFDILCDRRESLMEYLKENGIGSRPFYPPLHSEPAYDYTELSFPIAEQVGARGLWLPSSITVTDDEIKYICDKIKEFYLARAINQIIYT